MIKRTLSTQRRKKPTSYQYYQDRVDLIIQRILNRLPQVLHKDIYYLFKGKRIRSSLMFSLASHLGCRLSKIVLPSVGVEVIHTISLIHDDVIDCQKIRRNQSTLHQLYSNKAAVFMGDFLLHSLVQEMKGYHYSPKVVDVLYQKISELCRGEVLQDMPTEVTSPSRREYLSVIKQKTGSLFSYSFIIPALLSEKLSQSQVIVDFAEECGYLFGLGFQLADDIADLEEDVNSIKSKEISRLDNGFQGRLFSYPILLWQETDSSNFKKYFYNPSSTKLIEVQKKIQGLVLEEINTNLNELKVKKQKLNDERANKIFDFLKNKINQLFKIKI